MIRRVLSAVLIAWLLGLVLFAVSLPGARKDGRTDAVVVATGAEGRIARGLEVMRQGRAPLMLVTGVDRDVKAHEFAVEYGVDAARMECCVVLDYSALDTLGNARASAEWIRQRKLRSVRLVTSDWHMRRAAAEFRRLLPPDIRVIEDAVETEPSLKILIIEYHKLLARSLLSLWKH